MEASDGTFYMSVEDLHHYGTDLIINKDMTGKPRASFLMLDDKTNKRCSWISSYQDCRSHTLNLTSSVDQTVYVSYY